MFQKVKKVKSKICLFRSTYHCARATKWGDRLPIDVGKVQEPEESDNQEKNIE